MWGGCGATTAAKTLQGKGEVEGESCCFPADSPSVCCTVVVAAAGRWRLGCGAGASAAFFHVADRVKEKQQQGGGGGGGGGSRSAAADGAGDPGGASELPGKVPARRQRLS